MELDRVVDCIDGNVSRNLGCFCWTSDSLPLGKRRLEAISS